MPKFEHLRHKPATIRPEPLPLVLVLAPLRSNVNLSRIVRLAGCAGITRIYQCGQGKVDPEIARDAVHTVEVVQRRTLAPVLDQLKVEGFTRVGLEQTTHSDNLFHYQFPKKTALVIGNERQGLDEEALARLEAVVEIPVFGQPFSYNVATATTMAVYEYLRQEAMANP
jgi:tRNA G18 (ribose-2'-O)-methylase SpoU